MIFDVLAVNAWLEQQANNSEISHITRKICRNNQELWNDFSEALKICWKNRLRWNSKYRWQKFDDFRLLVGQVACCVLRVENYNAFRHSCQLNLCFIWIYFLFCCFLTDFPSAGKIIIAQKIDAIYFCV